jgi:hypothetical protein
VEHARLGRAYDVVVTVGRTRCVVEVVDAGVGMALPYPDGSPLVVTAQRGRSLLLIRAVMDGLEIRRVDPQGLAITMTKALTWVRDASSMWGGMGRADAVTLWKQLSDQSVAGVGPIAGQAHGFREFVITDPDGNRIGIGSTVVV